MRKLFTAAVLAVAFLAAGCSADQLARYQAGVNNLIKGVETTNDAIAATSAALSKNCSGMQSVAKEAYALASYFDPTGAAAQTLAVINEGITIWCKAPPQDIATAISTTAAIITAGKQAVDDIKATKATP